MELEQISDFGSPNASQDLWTTIAQQAYAPGQKEVHTKTTESSATPSATPEATPEAASLVVNDLSKAEREVAKNLWQSVNNGDTNAADRIIRQYAEWPRAMAKIVASVNAEFAGAGKGTVINFSYYDRLEIVSDKGTFNRPSDATWDNKAGMAVWYYSTWDDGALKKGEPMTLPDGRVVPPKEPMRWYDKSPIRIGKTSAYTENANDVSEPFRYTREDMGERLVRQD